MATAAVKQERRIATSTSRLGLASKVDLRNMALIMVGFLCTLLLIPPTRIYPVTDDWIYSQSVGELTHLAYRPHDWTQPIAIGHLAWGAAFAALFGNTFTVLTLANMVMSIACLLTFYLLLRQLRVKPQHALLGVALLGFNPIYIYISYSFMTDVTFLFYSLAACLLYIRGLEGHGDRWLWLGGLATVLAYLTRQYGILAIIPVLAYLWLHRSWTWRQAVAICALPIAAVVGYAVWEHFQPAPLINVQMDLVHKAMMRNLPAHLDDRALRVAWLLPSLGLSLAPLLKLPRRALWSVPVFSLLVFYQLKGLSVTGSIFPANGNVINNTGLLMYAYDANQVWNQAIWAVLGVLGGILISLQLTSWFEQAIGYIKSKPWRNPHITDAAFVPCALAFIVSSTVLVLTPFIFDRYWLAVLPLLMIPTLRSMSLAKAEDTPTGSNAPKDMPESKKVWVGVWRWGALLPVVAFSLLAIRDYKEHATVRWQAAESLVAAGAKVSQIKAGYEWEGWYNFREGAKRILETGDLTYINYPPGAVIYPVYGVSDLQADSYKQIGALPYHSWLEGGATRQVLLLKRK